MKKFTQRELIEDSHKKLALSYYDFSLLLLHFFYDLHKNIELSPQDKKKLKDPKYKKQIHNKLINENFTFSPVPEKYWENKEDTVLDEWLDQEFQQQLIAAHDDQKAIVKSIGKEINVALGNLYLFIEGERDDLDLDNVQSFKMSAYEHRILSIIYNNYEEIVKLMEELTPVNIHYNIELYKDVVTRDSSELIIKWSEKIKRIRSTRIGGRKQVDRNGFLLAIKKVLKIKGTDISRENIWRYFKRFNEQDPFFVDEYKIFFEPDMTGHDDDDYLVQKNYEKIRRIKKRTFYRYITEIRPKLKKEKK